MTQPRQIPPEIRRVQIDAADPDVSAFVSANAGSGKTHVLAQRVISLLLRGVDPAKILCITYTKAAAANMANRVFATLAKWTAIDDAALTEEIRLATGGTADARLRTRARCLFAAALETPGGLKVHTIHAFCTRLLHQFPFEANVAARFTVLDEAATDQLLDRLTLAVLLEASAEPDSALGRALATAIVVAADQTFKDVVGEAIRQRDTIESWLDNAGGVDAALAALSATLGLDPADTVESVEAEYFSHALIPPQQWPALVEILQSGSQTDRVRADALAAAHLASGRERIDRYLQIFCTTELTPRKNMMTRAIADEHPEWLARLIDEQHRVCALIARERALAARERTRALVTIAAEVIVRYRRDKERRALLDYNDLIDKTLALFARSSAAWVLYKLDLGIDHVLIDEAQDTSPKQWKIVETLISEFVQAGARADLKRTIFAVGDEKQSIFSFQGAAPHAFDEMRRTFARQFKAAGQDWRELRFQHSFRAGPNLLRSVDQVFAARDVYASVTTDQAGIPEHRPLPDASPGLVEIWPLQQAAARQEIEGWDAPFDTTTEQSPQVQLATKIARQLRHAIDNGHRAGDVLVLVRQRGPLFSAIIRALKDAGIEVAGADRLVLTEHIAVMDLLALGDALLLANDDLALAAALKSPLFGISEEQLFALAFERTGSLRASLRRQAANDPALAEANRMVEQWAIAARNLSPFAFYARVLGADRGRAKFLARLGLEANDALDEFLNLALDYEARETPSLQGFLNWLRAAQSQVKRDMEIARDEVRVMTVHGAKGLEARTVILADTTTPPHGPRGPRLLPVEGGALVWAVASSEDTDPIRAARTRAQTDARDEYRRLLYVAMTRAIERLIVCGYQGRNKIPAGCWYELICDALTPDCVAETSDIGEEVLRYRKAAPAAAVAPPSGKKPAPETVVLPDWATRDAAAEPRRLRTVTPSAALEDETEMSWPAAGDSRNDALLRGRLMHRLLQSLPDVAVERRAALAGKFLERSSLPAEQCASLAGQALALLDDQRFAALFGPDSRAEVPIVGRLAQDGQTIRVAGQIDRLAVAGDEVLIGDFKTNRPAPRRIEDVPKAYVGQLALYRALLARLYPRKRVRAALIWTEVPDLMELSEATLDAALRAIISP